MQLNIMHLSSTILFLSLRHVTSSLELIEIDKDTSSQKYLRSDSEYAQYHRQLSADNSNNKKKENRIFNWVFNFDKFKDNTKPGIFGAKPEIEDNISNSNDMEIDVTPEITTNSTDDDQQRAIKTIYILRHAEHNRECNEDKTECEEWLRPKGIRRVDRIINYMKDNDIINNITHVFASHLPRTSLTVLPIAELADVSVTTFPKDAEYSIAVVESVCPTLQAIKSAPMNSTIIISGHGRTIYQILSTGVNNKCNGLGLDTNNNQTIFPKENDGTLPEDDIGFSNLWKVSIIGETDDEKSVVIKLDEHVLI